MVVVVGDQQDGDTEDVILIPDQEGDNEIRKTKNVSSLSGVPLILTGNLIFGISIYIWTITHISWHEEAAPILWILIEIGIFMVTYGIIVYSNPPEIYNLEMIINGKQFSHSLPLKQILVSITNVICGVTGIITMCTLGPTWWPTWNIIGLILSILILLYSLISATPYYSKTNRHMISSPYLDLHSRKLNQCEDYLGELLDNQVKLFRKLLPFPSLSSFPIVDKVKKMPQRRITNKPVHILSILLAMVVCIVMFSAQLWYIATMDCYTEQGCYSSFDDPNDAFARDRDITQLARVEDRKLVILISTPITFLFCTILLLIIRETTQLRMLLSCLVCFGLGLFYFIFSIFSVQFIIMIGVSLSSLSKLLTLISLMPVPLLAALFMALAYSYILQMNKEDDVACPNKSKICMSISFILSIIFFSISLVTMTTSPLVTTSSMQGHWNTTQSQAWDEENTDNVFDDGHWDYDPITTIAPKAKLEKCYGKKLDHSVQKILTFFSISQLCLTEAILFFSFFFFLTSQIITKKSLFFPGILLFATASSTIKAFYSGIFQYELTGLPFLLLNGLNTLSALIIGFICIVIGGYVFICIITGIFRIICSIFVFVFIIILTVLRAFLKLACINMKANNMETHPEVRAA